MQLEKFNQLYIDETRAVFQACAHLPVWISKLIEQCPYFSLEQLYLFVAQLKLYFDFYNQK